MKIQLILRPAACLFVTGIVPFAFAQEPDIDLPAEVTHGPMLGRLTDTSVGVWMRTSLPSEIHVRYGTDQDRLDQFSDFGRTRLDHDNTGWVILKELRTDTRYYYRVNMEFWITIL